MSSSSTLLTPVADAPVTVGHPGTVTPRAGERTLWAREASNKMAGLLPEVIVNDAAAVKGIKVRPSSKLSCGYTCDLADEKGILQTGRIRRPPATDSLHTT